MFDFVQAWGARDVCSFKARLRAADLLLSDDLQVISGKDSTQEEFFHTINEIMAAGKRIVITADRCPQALDGVEPRILSRLAGGLVADIKAPEPALRRALLDRRCAELVDPAVPADLRVLPLGRTTTHIPELDSALTRRPAYAHNQQAARVG